MLYQAEHKAMVAHYLGLPCGTFYHWDYRPWARVRGAFQALTRRAHVWYNTQSAQPNVLCGEIWVRYIATHPEIVAPLLRFIARRRKAAEQ